MPRHLLMPVRRVSESSRCQLSNSTSPVLLASVPAELQAAMEMVFTSEFLLNLKTDISTPSHSLTPVRYVLESPRCQLSNGVSHVLLASVPAELQAALEMVFTGEFLLTLKTDISTPSHLLAPLCNGTSPILLASVPAELQAALEIVFTGEFLLNLKTDISTPSHSVAPIRHPSNGASPILLASVPAELQAAMEIVFTSEFLLNLKTDSSTPSHSLAPVRYLSNGVSHVLLASVPAELQAALEIVFTGEFLLTLKTDISTPSHSLAPIRHVPESPRCQLSNGASHVLLASVPIELQAVMELVFTGKFLLTLKTDISTPTIRSHPSDMFRNPLDASFPTAAPTASWRQSPPSYRLLWNWSLLVNFC
ncbi:hypothetical protein L873DRAFT_1812517 [Choiromyces venosus 120613-1]|uniref:Uncharacterized protein n=1 Tax=Choiromyces venosus 120613-1 TaxID=1336337 RepID=A0A3N4JPA8_9PEZI|nr:hypothetical protein L873DRAFT_1812517 [Choiromyces venosus 120613-1]